MLASGVRCSGENHYVHRSCLRAPAGEGVIDRNARPDIVKINAAMPLPIRLVGVPLLVAYVSRRIAKAQARHTDKEQRRVNDPGVEEGERRRRRRRGERERKREGGTICRQSELFDAVQV